MKRRWAMALVIFVTASVACGQNGTGNGASAGKGRVLMREMVAALGGQKWLDMKNEYSEGRMAGYFHGRPDGTLELYFDWREPLSSEREELTKKRDIVELYRDGSCTEVDYKGAHPQGAKICESYWRRRKHSIDEAVRVWLKQPGATVEFDGQTMAADHLADEVTLIRTDGGSMTIDLDDETHLPVRVSYEWRDPVYHDMDKDSVEFSDYHSINGIETPFTITYFHNGEMTEQRYVFHAAYNVNLPPGGFSVAKRK